MNAYDRAFRRLARLTDYETMATVPYHERTYGLARIEALLADLGHPCADTPVLQVVGSKGKGTTTAACAAILRAAGLRVGSYFSPHLSHPSERILMNGRPFPGPRFEQAVKRVLPLALRRAEGERPTFFELMTATALLLFEQARADAVVLEAGMGGRLDATTAPRRAAVLLTSISLDHTAQLGTTVERIAREKAATARRGVPFYSAVPPGSAAGRVVARICRRAGAPLKTVGRHWRMAHAVTRLASTGASTAFDLRLPSGASRYSLSLPLLGVHQAGNAALAAAALLDLADHGVAAVNPEVVRRGLAATRSPARLEVLGRRPLVIVDGAHNAASMRATVAAVEEVADPKGRLHVVFAANRDKDLDGMIRALAGHGRVRLCITFVNTPRRADPREILRLARARRVEAVEAGSPREALARALFEAKRKDAVLVTGSMYLAGALRPLLARRR